MSSAALVVACALSILGRNARSLPPITLVDVPPPAVSRLAAGFTEGHAIYLVTSSEMFRIASAAAWRARPHCGDRPAVAKIASVIVHEEWHIRHGSDERGAYDARPPRCCGSASRSSLPSSAA